MTKPLFPQGGADISDCGKYRYRLWRQGWSPDDRACLFVMLNPSTADAEVNDPTVRKCIGFATRWGYGLLMVCNLFAFRSRHPKDLLSPVAKQDPVGPENEDFLHRELQAASRIVLAWGSHHEVDKLVAARVAELRDTLAMHRGRCGTLGVCADGNPRHPLMLPYAAPFTEWKP